MKKSAVVGGIALGSIGAFLAASVWPEDTDSSSYLDSDVVARGKTLYAEYCAACHGANLGGEPNWQERDAEGFLPAPPHDATGHTWHHPDQQLFQITKLGTEAIVGGGYRSKMAAFGDTLSDDEIWSVLAYIKSTWPQRVIERHDELNAAYNAAN